MTDCDLLTFYILVCGLGGCHMIFYCWNFQHMCVIQNVNSPLDCELFGVYWGQGLYSYISGYSVSIQQLLSNYSMAGSLAGTNKTENNLRFITPLLWPTMLIASNWTIPTEVLGNYFHCLMNTRLRWNVSFNCLIEIASIP